MGFFLVVYNFTYGHNYHNNNHNHIIILGEYDLGIILYKNYYDIVLLSYDNLKLFSSAIEYDGGV